MVRSVIIDDEADARETLELAVKQCCPEIELVAICASGQAGLEAIMEHKPDLVFLDVQMPGMTGFDLLQRLDRIDFAVIFVTSYDRYAIRAIKFSALDYLLKPFDPDDLAVAVERFKKQQHTQHLQSQYQTIFGNIRNQTGAFEKLAVPTLDGLLFVRVEDIIYCQAEGSYTTIYQKGGQKTLISKTLRDFENLLEEAGFCRVHHSNLINLKHIQKYVKGEGGYVELTDGHHVDVSRRKKEQFLNMLARL